MLAPRLLTSTAARLGVPRPAHARTPFMRVAGSGVPRSSNPSQARAFTTSKQDHAGNSQSSTYSKRAFWATALSAGILSIFLAQPLLLAAEDTTDKKKPPFTKEQIGVICIIGGPSSGKSTQLQNASKRFNLITLDASKQDLKQEIEKLAVKENTGKEGEKKVRVVIEGFPRTLEQANKFQDEVVPILLIISIVLDAPKGIERVKGDDESLRRDAKINWKRFEDNSEGLIKQFRYQGNILEITGEWPQDEVWEQVEAKLESALELDDRGEL